jgi:broad specificity phosphatase PhoE
MRYRILLIILACCVIGNTFATDENNSYSLYLVRHAEKFADGRQDPGLTKYGIGRSERLAYLLKDRNIEDVWSSDYKRTRETTEPLLATLDLKLKIYDARDLGALVENLMSRRNNALIVGHSNTTPDLARILCQCDIADMEETEHDRLIVVSVTDNGTHVEIIQQSNPPQPWPAIAK